MRAVLARAYGGPEVLRCERVAAPAPGPHEVLIASEVATVNFADVKARRGDGTAPLPWIPGHDVVGRVEAVGEQVEGIAVGERVGALVWSGAYAERVAADAALVVQVPDAVASEQAAGLVSMATAWNALTLAGRIAPGDAVLVHAAGGGVGSVAVQLARELGARVVVGAVRSPQKADAVERAGAVALVTGYGDEHAAAARRLAGGPLDLVVDLVGGAAVVAGLAALGTFGRFVSIGNVSGQDAQPSVVALQQASQSLVGFRGRAYQRERADLVAAAAAHALALLAEGRLEVAVAGRFALEEAAAAHAAIERGERAGKLLLVP